MRQERETQENMHPSAYLNSPFKGLLVLTAMVALVEWGLPAATKAGIGLTDKIGETVAK